MENVAETGGNEFVEAFRHNKTYKEKGSIFVLPPYDWEKFDLIENPTHGYTYSVKFLGNIRGRKILDMGCGTGWLSVILAKRGGRVEAMDISEEAVKIAKEMAKANHVHDRINLKVGSAHDLPYPDNHFDLVIGQAILHHLSEKSKLATTLHRVLKPGGRAVFFEPFGESAFLERLRLLIPVPVEEEDKSHWNMQFKYRDLAAFRNAFTVKYREFQLLSRLDRIISNQTFVAFLGRFDVFVLKYIPFLRRYARTIVIELEKPRSGKGRKPKRPPREA